MKRVVVKHPILRSNGGSVFLSVCFFDKPKVLNLVRQRILYLSDKGRSPFRINGHRLRLVYWGGVNQGGSFKLDISSALYLGYGSLQDEASQVEQALTTWLTEFKRALPSEEGSSLKKGIWK